MNTKILKQLNKKLSIFITVFIVAVTLFLVVEKASLINHSHCEEEQCPICEIAYIVNSELKNIESSGASGKFTFVTFIFILLVNIIGLKIFVQELSLVKNKIRLND